MGIHYHSSRYSQLRRAVDEYTGRSTVRKKIDRRRMCNSIPLLIAYCSLGMSGCSLSDLVRVDNPSTSITPQQVATATDALGLYSGAIQVLKKAYASDVVLSGIFTDEFQDTASQKTIDTRTFQAGNNVPMIRDTYLQLQQVRMQGLQAIDAMRQFPDVIPSPLIGRVYSIIAYAELLLAERFCSGVSLATIPPGGGVVTYSTGLSTAALLTIAVAHFDTALELTGQDSVRFQSFARVGKARALLGLNRFSDAAIAAASVPTDFAYHAEFSATDTNSVRPQTGGTVFVSDTGEGRNGIDWLGAQDPRVPVRDTVKGLVRSSKYATKTSPIAIADGIEARLIEAEALLADGNSNWLVTLNSLRARLAPVNGVRALADTTDPGTAASRIDLLFRERAFWLYATGHRHGDLRRLVRQYRRNISAVFPSGPYLPRFSTAPPEYGATVVFPVPVDDRSEKNPLYQGCYDTNA